MVDDEERERERLWIVRSREREWERGSEIEGVRERGSERDGARERGSEREGARESWLMMRRRERERWWGERGSERGREGVRERWWMMRRREREWEKVNYEKDMLQMDCGYNKWYVVCGVWCVVCAWFTERVMRWE